MSHSPSPAKSHHKSPKRPAAVGASSSAPVSANMVSKMVSPRGSAASKETTIRSTHAGEASRVFNPAARSRILTQYRIKKPRIAYEPVASPDISPPKVIKVPEMKVFSTVVRHDEKPSESAVAADDTADMIDGQLNSLETGEDEDEALDDQEELQDEDDEMVEVEDNDDDDNAEQAEEENGEVQDDDNNMQEAKDDGELYFPEQILAQRGFATTLQYLIQWQGYPNPSQHTWEHASNMEQVAPTLVQAWQDARQSHTKQTSQGKTTARDTSPVPSYNETYIVEAVMAKRSVKNTTQYLIKWLGYDDERDQTWEPSTTMRVDIPTMIEAFEQRARQRKTKGKSRHAAPKTARVAKSRPKQSLLQPLRKGALAS